MVQFPFSSLLGDFLNLNSLYFRYIDYATISDGVSLQEIWEDMSSWCCVSCVLGHDWRPLQLFKVQMHFMTGSPFGNFPQAELERHFFLSDV
jgi:hypothetical protein